MANLTPLLNVHQARQQGQIWRQVSVLVFFYALQLPSQHDIKNQPRNIVFRGFHFLRDSGARRQRDLTVRVAVNMMTHPSSRLRSELDAGGLLLPVLARMPE